MCIQVVELQPEVPSQRKADIFNLSRGLGIGTRRRHHCQIIDTCLQHAATGQPKTERTRPINERSGPQQEPMRHKPSLEPKRFRIAKPTPCFAIGDASANSHRHRPAFGALTHATNEKVRLMLPTSAGGAGMPPRSHDTHMRAPAALLCAKQHKPEECDH